MLILAAACFVGTVANAQHLGTEYRLKKVVEVPGRQGIAADKDFFYVSDTRGLYKYDHNWNLVAKRVQTKSDPLFPNPENANHFGDIDVYDGKIYTGNEKFAFGRGQNIAVSIYDANTLKWIKDIPWCAESGQVEVSGLAVDREKNLIWMSDWLTAVTYIATAWRLASTTLRCSAAPLLTGARVSTLPTARCSSRPTTVNQLTVSLTASTSPT